MGFASAAPPVRRWIGAWLLALSSAAWPAHAADDDPAAGWYYLWAQCIQEPSTSDSPTICETGREGEWRQAFAVSSVFSRGDGDFTAHEVFEAEVARRFGSVAEVREVGPFDSFRDAEAAIVKSISSSRRFEQGQLAVTAVAIEPERLDDEPNDEERRAAPSPLPPVMASYSGGSARVWREASACGLRLEDGTEILPALVNETFGEKGELCPEELAEDLGIFRFDVPRNGMICGEAGVCTELFDSEGQWLGVIEYTPYPVISIDLLREWGIIQTGEWDQRLYSIPERRFLFTRWPGDEPELEAHVIVGGHFIVDDRPVIELRREYRERDADVGYYFLDTMVFEQAGSW